MTGRRTAWSGDRSAADERPGVRVVSRISRSLLIDLRMRSDIVPGAVFPDYELSDYTGKRRKPSELQGQHPMILVLGRGGFCPKDRRQHL
jgi:hypothetical protein